ncbi:MAG: hypothetical protein A2169_07880 [Deltaproteobacteria bacterium RBG_13_47_9]|nr:MAG: hypothetical protein A2169_07880 [Deltaproteobacteria bacterium RBG_13_47_9]
MAKKTRLVVTGHNDDGKSVVVSDDDAPHVHVFESSGGLTVTDLWLTSTIPADHSASGEPGSRSFTIEPPSNGSVFRVIDYPPDKVRFLNMDRETAYRDMGAAHALVKKDARYPMHKTHTIDYAVILSGEIYAVMDEGEVLLKAGDCLIQRGTSHAWSNRTDELCRIVFVLIDAKPL